MKNVNVFVFIVAPVQAYLLFSDLIKLTFRPWHLLIHESFTTREVSFENRTEELGDILTLLANLEESGTGIRHEICLAALGTAINDSVAPTLSLLCRLWRYAHKQGKEEHQCAAAECQ